MDSTLISTRPDEGTLSLSRARRAALGSFAGAVVDWYDFLLYGITAALVFNREFFPQVSPAMGTLAAFAGGREKPSSLLPMTVKRLRRSRLRSAAASGRRPCARGLFPHAPILSPARFFR